MSLLVVVTIVLVVWLLLVMALLKLSAPRRVDAGVVLVTGGANGLGRTMAQEFLARRSATILDAGNDQQPVVVVWDIEPEPAAEEGTVENSSNDLKIIHQIVDMADAKAVSLAAAVFIEKYGPPAVLVNNAGVVHGKGILELTDAEIIRSFDVNVLAHFRTIRAFLPAMIANRSGHIVCVSSAVALGAVPYLPAYSASKAASFSLMEAIRLELKSPEFKGADRFIHTTTVCPGLMDTRMFRGSRAAMEWLTPTLHAADVAKWTVDAVDSKKTELWVPLYVRGIPVLRIFPSDVFDFLQWGIGVYSSIQGFRDRRMKETKKE